MFFSFFPLQPDYLQMDFSKFIQLFSIFERSYKKQIKLTHEKWVIDSRKKLANPKSDKEYQEQIAKMIIFLENDPSSLKTLMFDMRFLFENKSGSYSFINPIVKEVFLDEYLTDEAIEWFVKENHDDYTGSLFGSLLELYIKRKLLTRTAKSLKFSKDLVFKCDDIYQGVLRYKKKGGPNITFEFGSMRHLSTAGGYFLFPSQEAFPVYDLAYKDDDSHIYYIGIRSYRFKEGNTKFPPNKEVLSPKNIDKLYSHFNDYKELLGNFFYLFIDVNF